MFNLIVDFPMWRRPIIFMDVVKSMPNDNDNGDRIKEYDEGN
jgi:hypothetical protein